MSSSIAPAALKPSAPSVKGKGSADATEASGFSGLLDTPAGDRKRQPASPSSAAHSPAESARRHDHAASENRTSDPASPPPPNEAEAADHAIAATGTKPSGKAGEEGKAEAGKEKEANDPEHPKHRTIATDIAAVLFGLSASGIVNPSRSATGTVAGSPAMPTAGGSESGAKGTDQAEAVLAKSLADPNTVMRSGRLASVPPVAGEAPGSAGPAPTIPATAPETPNAGTPQQSSSPARLQGVTVTTVSGAPPAAEPVEAGNPQLAAIGPGAMNAAPSDATGTNMPGGTEADRNGGSSSAVSQAAPAALPRSSGRGAATGGDAGTNGQSGDGHPEKSPQAAPRNASSAQVTGSPAFSGFGGSSLPLLGQTASSFVAGMGAPQSWADYLGPAATMANGPAMAGPVRSLSIALQPAALGSVTANLHLSGQQLRIDVEVQTEEAHQRLSNDTDDIVKSLRSLGFDVSHVTIRHGGNAPPAAQGANQTAGQAQGHTPFQASANSGGSGGGAARGNTGKHDADRDSHAPASRPMGGDGISRGLYI